jgi:membrane protein implicated in regulation of membrane protease activity
LTGAAIVMLVIFPIGAFIAGCILLGKKAAGAGAVIMILAVVSSYIWYGILTAGEDDCHTSYYGTTC